MALDRQGPKISGPSVNQRASTRRLKLRQRNTRRQFYPTSRARTCHTCLQRYDVMDDVILNNRLTRLFGPTWFDLDQPGNLTWSEPPQKKKKKKVERERKNALTKWTLDLDQKVKIVKTDLSHSIFRVHSDFGTHFFI